MAKLFVSNDPDASARIFKSDFLEKFTKVHWSVPLWLFIPIIGYFLYRSFAILDIDILKGVLYFIFGIFIWTLTEYSLHRWLFHFHPKSDLGKRLIFMFHGVHHDFPSDRYRLVMPPSASLPLATFFFFLFYFIFGPVLVSPFFAGFLTGYLFYDITHYALHHFPIRKRFWIDLKKHHTKHHFQNPELGFGVSNSFWDVIFRTGYKKD